MPYEDDDHPPATRNLPDESRQHLARLYGCRRVQSIHLQHVVFEAPVRCFDERQGMLRRKFRHLPAEEMVKEAC